MVLTQKRVKKLACLITVLFGIAIIAGAYFDIDLTLLVSANTLWLITFAFILWRLNDPSKLGSPFDTIKTEDTFLKVGERLIPLGEIKKVVVEASKGVGYFQLPYNGGGEIGLRFHPDYVDELKSYIQRAIPDVTFIK